MCKEVDAILSLIGRKEKADSLLSRIYAEEEEHVGSILPGQASFYKLCDARGEGDHCLKCDIADYFIEEEKYEQPIHSRGTEAENGEQRQPLNSEAVSSPS